MSRLAHIQAAFQRFLLTADSEIESHVVGTPRVSVATRLGIYGGGYRSRLIEILELSYPVLANLMGEADFHALGAKYVATHESTFCNARYYGDELADFLAAAAEYAGAPLLAELAQWEWAMAAAFDAADEAPIDSSAFAPLAPEDWAELRLAWSPTVQVLALEWNAPELWKAVTADTERPEPSLSPQPERDRNAVEEIPRSTYGATWGSGGNPEKRQRRDAGQPVSWLIWRRELQIYFRPLSVPEAAVIAASRAGQSFGELCVLLCEHVGESEASLHAAGFLRGWVEAGLIVSAEHPR